MIIQDAIDFAESIFDARMGFPGRFSDGPEIVLNTNHTILGRQEYVELQFTWKPDTFVDINDYRQLASHYLCASLIHYVDALKRRCHTNSRRPVLLWRWKDKVRLSASGDVFTAQTRVHLEGCKDYGTARVRDGAHAEYIRLVVDNARPHVTLLALNHELEGSYL